MKTCTKCGKTKEDDEFYKHKRLCKECYALKNKQAYEEKTGVDENTVPVDENKYEKTELTELILSLGKEYDSKVEILTAQFESDLEKLADNINNTIDVLQKNIAVLVDTNRIQHDTLQEAKKEIVVLRATDVNHQTVISKLMKENESLNEKMNEMTDEIKTMNIKIDAIYKYIEEKAEYDTKKEKAEYEKQDDTSSVKSEKQNSPIRFDIPEDKPVSGSAVRKGYPSRDDVIFTKNRVMQNMKAEDLKNIAKQLDIKTSKLTGGYKTKDELKYDILEKLNSWLDKQ